MKHLKTIKLVAATGLVLGSLNAAASGFGGGWMHDKHTGTLYYSLAPESEQQATAEKQQSGGHMNSFGGGWVQDKNTGTIYNSLAPTPERHHASHDKKHGGGHMNSFGGGWVQDKNTGTIYYSHADKVKQGTGFSPS